MNLIKRVAFASLCLVGLVSARPPVWQASTLTLSLGRPTLFNQRRDMHLMVVAYRARLQALTTDRVIFEEPEENQPILVKAIVKKTISKTQIWSPTNLHKRAEQYLAGVLYGECRGQNLTCMTWVGHVALNRAKLNLDRRWGSGVYGVLNKHKQFSCLNKNDPNRSKIMKAIAGKLDPHSPDGIKWTMALGKAHELMHRLDKDPTGSATFYFAKSMKTPPVWVHDKNMIKTASIDGHIFYKQIN